MVLACVTRELRVFNGRATQPILILLVEICIIYIYILVLVPFHMLSLTRRTLDKERVANIHHLAAKLGYALHFAYRRVYFGLLSRTPALSVADCIPKNWVFLLLGLPGIW